MSLGELIFPIDIVSITYGKDEEGFKTETENVLASVHAKRINKSATEKWTNKALLQDATVIFQFRFIPGITVTNKNVIRCNGEKYLILSVENIRNRNRYIEAVCKLEVPSDG